MAEDRLAAICLAAGQGKRMGSGGPKQYRLLAGKPVLFYPLKAFEESPVDQVVLVTGTGEEEYCRREILEKYGFAKVKAVVAGGKERCHSVMAGLAALDGCEYVLIHDGARPFLSEGIIRRCLKGVKEHGACVAGMPVKDTVKLADEEQNIASTPDRSRVWMIQTPQAFSYPLIKEAYGRLAALEKEGGVTKLPMTDDAMVVEYFLQKKIRLVKGSYRNIKLTTPEDMPVAEALIKPHSMPIDGRPLLPL